MKLVVAVLGCLLMTTIARADTPAGMPPDVAKIFDKIRAGQQPTAADAQRLREWQQDILKQAHGPVPKGAIQPDGIPVRVTVSTHYTEKTQSSTNTYTVGGTADALMYVEENGTADYSVDRAHGSMFTIKPILADGGFAPGGHGHAHWANSASANAADGALDHTSFAGMFITTGKGDGLFATGSFGGSINGTRTYVDAWGVHQRKLTGVDGYQQEFGNVGVFMGEQHENPVLGTPTPAPIAQLSYRTLAAAVASGRPTTISTSETFDWQDNTIHTHGESSITLSIRPPKIELVIQPVSQDDYESWMPLPDLKEGGDKTLFGTPKPFPLRIALHDTKDGAATGKAHVPADAPLDCALDVTLDDVSKHAGVAMNFPPEHTTSPDKPDLFFPKDGQAKGVVVDADGQHLHITTKVKELIIQVAARDTGAFAGVKAECKELGITSRDPRTGDEALAMPMDDNKNRVADEWEKTYGIYGENLPATWDDEDTPGDFSVKGDGLTLFEEYRGVIDDVNGKEQFDRLDPRHMKLFLRVDVTSSDANLIRAGAAMYAKATGVEIRYVHDGDQLAMLDGALHWLNFRRSQFTLAKQAAVVIRMVDHASGANGFTQSIAAQSDDQPFTPATTSFINVSHYNCYTQVKNWLSWIPAAVATGKPTTLVAGAVDAGVNLARVPAPNDAVARALTSLLIEWVTMHELGHATGAQHHNLAEQAKLDNRIPDQEEQAQDLQAGGDHACPMRYWNFGERKKDLVLFLISRWDLSTPADGGNWHFCDVDRKHMRIKPK